jgi:CBS domain containing-hemolysin-like protein
MSLDMTNLAILEIAGTPQQKFYASRIIPIRKNGHILLITLLLTNTVLNETLPILFDGIFSKGFISVIVSTALLVLFSEIIPQSIFSKHGLAIGALFAYPVRILIVMWFVISWPISKFLDYVLGRHEGFTYGAAGKHFYFIL